MVHTLPPLLEIDGDRCDGGMGGRRAHGDADWHKDSKEACQLIRPSAGRLRGTVALREQRSQYCDPCLVSGAIQMEMIES